MCFKKQKRQNKKDGVKKYRKKPYVDHIVCVGFILYDEIE